MDGRIRTLPGVLHILNLARNLMFVENMDVVGVKNVCEDGGFKMVRGSMVLIRGVQYGTLYKILRRTIIHECNSSIVLEDGAKDDITLNASGGKTMLWNQRLGYIGVKGLRALQGKGMVEGMYDCTLDFDIYEHFIYGKQNWVIFSSGATKEKGILKLIHSDVFGHVYVHY